MDIDFFLSRQKLQKRYAYPWKWADLHNHSIKYSYISSCKNVALPHLTFWYLPGHKYQNIIKSETATLSQLVHFQRKDDYYFLPNPQLKGMQITKGRVENVF